MFEKLKRRWDVKSNFQIILILLVFSITGSVSAWVSKPFVEWIGLSELPIPNWLLLIIRLIIIFPFYNVLLLVVGTIFGQFKFFWAFERKMFSRFIPSKIKKDE